MLRVRITRAAFLMGISANVSVAAENGDMQPISHPLCGSPSHFTSGKNRIGGYR